MKCRVCREVKFELIFTKASYRIYRCSRCGFGTISPLPTDEVLNKIYNSPHYHEDKSLAEHTEDAVHKWSHVRQFLSPRRQLLDFGCGNGAFLKLASSVVTATGYEISEVTATAASTHSGCTVVSGLPLNSRFPSHSLDVVTCFDVLEHIIPFQAVLACWHRWLKPQGLVCFTTPDLDSWDHRLLRSYWYGFTKIPQHLNYFNRHSIKLVLERAGFTIVTLKTWGFARSLSFIAAKLPGSTISKPLLRRLGLHDHIISLPMIDMMVVARKIS